MRYFDNLGACAAFGIDTCTAKGALIYLKKDINYKTRVSVHKQFQKFGSISQDGSGILILLWNENHCLINELIR